MMKLIEDQERTLISIEPGLTEAWAAAEAALPEGWIGPSLVTETSVAGTGLPTFGWRAFAWDYAHPHRQPPGGIGPTPAAALLALAAALRSHTDG